MSASCSKLGNETFSTAEEIPGLVFGNRIVDLELTVEAFAQLCCPKCFAEKVELFEDSGCGLCSHFTLKCKGFAGAFKLCLILNLLRLTKTAYKNQEAKLLIVVQEVAEESMIKAATEIVEKKQNLSSDIVKCGISVDGSEEAIHLRMAVLLQYQLILSHTSGLALHTTVAGKCSSSPDDEQEKQKREQGESRTFFMNSVASTLNRVTDMEFNNQISVLTPNKWNTWKHDMQVLLMHYGCWQFIMQTKPEQPDEEATYKEKLDLQLLAAWKILKDHFEPVTRARVIQLLDHFFGTKYQPGEDVGIFISRVKTAATRLQEAGHKLDDLYIGFQLIRWLPQEFQSTVQQIYRWKEEDFRVVKIEAELILEANRLQLMKQDLEKAENAYLSSFTSKKSKTLPGATAAAHGDPNGKNDYQKKGGKVFNCKTIKNVKQSIKTIGPCYVCNKYGHLKVNCKEKKSLQKSPSTVNETFNTEFDKGDKGVWGFSDLSEQQEALMVEVTIPNCYKQAIRSRNASKWHDAMDKEINVMMERLVWDLVDHPDNIKILENRWVYTIK
ncbi:retrovirus-related Pol polyprotein from transposon TNT 1-94 [Trichonephila clavipes]|nr:retrovirus-related Pol polyprotein from transposon TNT 1-94 [Trichonephila clavipes]